MITLGYPKKPSARVAALRSLLAWLEQQPRVSGSAVARVAARERREKWLSERPALHLDLTEIEEMAAALWGFENGVSIETLVARELAATSVLPDDFWYDNLAGLLQTTPYAIESLRVRWLLANFLHGDGINGAPKTSPKERAAVLRALGRGLRRVSVDYEKYEKAQKVWRKVDELVNRGMKAGEAAEKIAGQLGMKPNMVKNLASFGRRSAGQPHAPIGKKRKRPRA